MNEMYKNEVIEIAYKLIVEYADACINTKDESGIARFIEGVSCMTEAILDDLKYERYDESKKVN